jgi:hypothetical protein
MKKIILLVLLMGTLNLWSQTSQRLTLNSMAENFQVVIHPNDNLFLPGHLNDINTNAFRHFITSFENAENIVWRIGKTGSTVSFTWKDQNVTCYYDNIGDYLYSIKVYTESELEGSISHFVRSETGKGYSIYLLTEKEMTNGSLFEISLQNTKYWCKIRFVRKDDGSFEKISDNIIFLKG